MNFFLNLVLLDQVFNDRDITEGIMSVIGFFICVGVYLYLMWKGAGFIESHIALFPVFLAAFSILTILLPRYRDRGTPLRKDIYTLLAVINIAVGFSIVFCIAHFLGNGIANFTYQHSISYIVALLTKGNFIFRLLGALITLAFGFINAMLDLAILPFCLIPTVQKFIWRAMGINWTR